MGTAPRWVPLSQETRIEKEVNCVQREQRGGRERRRQRDRRTDRQRDRGRDLEWC